MNILSVSPARSILVFALLTAIGCGQSADPSDVITGRADTVTHDAVVIADIGADLSVVQPNCGAATSCDQCALVVGCGWCTGTRQCLGGNETASTDGTCVSPSWDFTGDDCVPTTPPDAGMSQPDVAVGPCVPTVSRGGESTDALCSNGIDDDCNGYIDCDDFRCSRNSQVSVCRDGGVVPIRDAGIMMVDAGPAGPISARGGTVNLLHFGVFGDVRPATNDGTTYPTAVITSVMQNFVDLGAQFAAAQGDYMFATTASVVNSHIDSLLSAESVYGGYVFHGMGNHECTGATASNCPLGNETSNVRAYMSRLAVGQSAPYFDWTIHTSLGDAHFISTAANAWSTQQQTWLTNALAQPATYTFVLAHEPPSGTQGPGSGAIDSIFSSHTGTITMRFYGHTHEYRHITGNQVIDGNAGAPLQATGGNGDFYGFAMVDQRADGNIVFSAYQIGSPPMLVDSFVVTPSGSLSH